MANSQRAEAISTLMELMEDGSDEGPKLGDI
jgi:hypothetical protein